MHPLDKTPYTPGMRETLRLSKAEAGRLGHDYIGPEHYLLGILRKGDGLAITVLQNMEVNLDEIKSEIEHAFEVDSAMEVGVFQPNSQAKRVLDQIRRIAEEMKHGWIGTEHLLLALIRCENTLPAKIMAAHGVSFQRAQQEVMDVIENSQTPVTCASAGKAPETEIERREALPTEIERKKESEIERKKALALAEVEKELEIREQVARGMPAPLAIELARSIAMLGAIQRLLSKHDSASKTLHYGLAILRPAFLKSPEETAPLMKILFEDYITEIGHIGQLPDEKLIEPILDAFQKLLEGNNQAG